MTAASFVPVILTVITCRVPSAASTVNVSVWLWPSANSLYALLATNVHLPAASMLNLPYWPATSVCSLNSAVPSTSTDVS